MAGDSELGVAEVALILDLCANVTLQTGSPVSLHNSNTLVLPLIEHGLVRCRECHYLPPK